MSWLGRNEAQVKMEGKLFHCRDILVINWLDEMGKLMDLWDSV